MAAAGIAFRYYVVDVGEKEAVAAAVLRVAKELGPVTGIVHAAAVNAPRLLGALEEAQVQQTLRPKIQGARNLLTANTRTASASSSRSARSSLGRACREADYGLANEWLTRLTDEWQAAHPACRCLAVEWSCSGRASGWANASAALIR